MVPENDGDEEAADPGQREQCPLPNKGKLRSNLDTMGVYGDFYVKRALVAMVGLGANPAEGAVYPLLLADADGKPLDGGSTYLLHFGADSLPPVDAFWSVTMYDGQGFQAANPINRFPTGDRDDLRSWE